MKRLDLFFDKYLKGDKYLWAFISLLSIFSFLPIYSVSSNLIIKYGGNLNIAFFHLLQHMTFIIIGFFILFFSQFINYKHLYKISGFLIPVVLILLILTNLQGYKKIHDGINASRWLHLPFINISFQTSKISSLILFIYCARYLDQKKKEYIGFFQSFIPLLVPIFLIVGLIFPSNGSTAMITFFSILILLFIGGYPLPHIFGTFLIGIFLSVLSIYIVIKWNEKYPFHGVFTWKNRIEIFLKYKEDYQMIQSKSAIILGNIFGQGPGKSKLKTYLPQSSSDFIYSIIVEEYGMVGGILLLFLYLLILFRIIIIATKVKNFFCSLLVFSLGFPIINQAIINIGITIGLFPITGQSLPLMSLGATSIWTTFFSFGIILSISRRIYEKYQIIE